MTKREWDALTQYNYGAHWSERTYYRRERAGLPRDEPLPIDFLASRATGMAYAARFFSLRY